MCSGTTYDRSPPPACGALSVQCTPYLGAPSLDVRKQDSAKADTYLVRATHYEAIIDSDFVWLSRLILGTNPFSHTTTACVHTPMFWLS